VYSCILKYTNRQTKEAWPSYQTIANNMGISRRQVIREVEKLVQFGLIFVKPATNYGTNHFFILDEEHWHVPADFKPSKKRTAAKKKDASGDSQSLPQNSGDSQSLVTHSHKTSDSQSPGSDSQSPKQYLLNNTNEQSLSPYPLLKKETDSRNEQHGREREAAPQEKTQENAVYRECADLLHTEPIRIKQIRRKYRLSLDAVANGCRQAASDTALRSKLWWLTKSDDAWCDGEYVPYGTTDNDGNGANPALAWFYGLSESDQEQLEQTLIVRFASVLDRLSPEKRRAHQTFQKALIEVYQERQEGT